MYISLIFPFLLVSALMSVMTLSLFAIDKQKAIRHEWRIAERVLLLCSALMGGAGGLLGMITCHHKTRKKAFLILVPLFGIDWIDGD